MNGRAYKTPATAENGIPAAATRGASCYGEEAAGAFAVDWSYGPSSWGNDMGFRCCLGR